MMIECLHAVTMLAVVATSALAQQIPADTAAMDAHLRFLSSDLLEGRAPATRGGRLAAEYIAAQFQAMGCSRPERTAAIPTGRTRRDDSPSGTCLGQGERAGQPGLP